MATTIHIYCPAEGLGLARSDLEEELEFFFGQAANDVGAGTGETGFNLDYELLDGEDGDLWLSRLCDFLRQIGVRPGTIVDFFPDDWDSGSQFHRTVI